MKKRLQASNAAAQDAQAALCSLTAVDKGGTQQLWSTLRGFFARTSKDRAVTCRLTVHPPVLSFYLREARRPETGSITAWDPRRGSELLSPTLGATFYLAPKAL